MDLKKLQGAIEEYRDGFKTHAKMFDILDGNLSCHLDAWLGEQLSGESIRYAMARKAPVNILKKVIDKLSTIYQQHPIRIISTESESDKTLFDNYLSWFQMNATMNNANEFFNLSRCTLLQPYVHKGVPRLRAVPNDRFLVMSDDEIDPLNPTHVMTSHGSQWHIWTDDEFLVMENGAVDKAEMARLGNPEGINPYGRIPFIYTNRSSTRLVPKPDVDALAMTLLIPGLLTDLNFASMFSLFSIIYGIDIDNEKLNMAPNAFWKFYSDASTDKKPEIGTIKPEADINGTLELVKSQLAIWLQSKNIKPGTVGDAEGSSFASAISKMVDEADTTDEKKKQSDIFQDTEYKLWDLVAHHMHPQWSRTRQIPVGPEFSSDFYVSIQFRDSIPLIRRADLIRDLKEEVDSGFTTKRRAIERLNPSLDSNEIDELIEEIAEENQIVIREIPSGATESEDRDSEGV